MAEQQAIRDAARTESQPRFSTSIQTEAMQLLSGSPRPENRQAQQQTGRNIDLPNVFAQLKATSDAPGACTTNPNPRCESDNRWRPDYQRNTQAGRNWDRDAQVQRAKPIETGPNDNYRVQKGDCLEDIARRMLREESSSPRNLSRREIADATRRLLEANPQLRCNPDLIRPGMELRIPRRSGASEERDGNKEKPVDIKKEEKPTESRQHEKPTGPRKHEKPAEPAM